MGDFLSDGPGAHGVFVFLIAARPGTVAYLAWRTVFASALVSLLPVYFAIAEINRGRTLHMPAIAVDRAVSLQPSAASTVTATFVFGMGPSKV